MKDASVLVPGLHTLTARAIDRMGNQAETNVTIFFDHVPPAVSITSPASGTMVSGTITVMVEASDSISGVASVNLYINNQLHSTLTQPPFNFAVDTSGFVPGSYTVTARAIDRVGNQAEASIALSVSAFRIEIISPVNGATINKSRTIVYGKMYEQTGETGVVVNGVLAEVQGGDFAVIVPLQIGQNIITATATRPDGIQGQAQITINIETQEEFIRLTATPTSGILDQTGILNVTFEAEAYLVNPVSSYSWDFNGDGTPETTGTEATVIAQYQFPGIYFPRVTVTDNQGNTFTETTLVSILSREEMDVLLQSKWEGMKGALANQDIESAIRNFASSGQLTYKEQFIALQSILADIVNELNAAQIIMVSVEDNEAEYEILVTREGAPFSFHLKFIKDSDGLWKIWRF